MEVGETGLHGSSLGACARHSPRVYARANVGLTPASRAACRQGAAGELSRAACCRPSPSPGGVPLQPGTGTRCPNPVVTCLQTGDTGAGAPAQ